MVVVRLASDFLKQYVNLAVQSSHALLHAKIEYTTFMKELWFGVLC